MIMGKFRLIEKTDKLKGTTEYYIQDVETKKKLDLTKKKDLKLLVNLMNDYYSIIKDKWKI